MNILFFYVQGLVNNSSIPQQQQQSSPQQQQQQQSDSFSRSCNSSNSGPENDIDKIETICESDPKPKRENRFRHSSECAGFGSLAFETGLRGFKFHEDFFNFRQNLFDGRPLFFGSSASENASKRKR
jgi:hypothetical protein